MASHCRTPPLAAPPVALDRTHVRMCCVRCDDDDGAMVARCWLLVQSIIDQQMDYYKASVNPCSVESIAEGVELDSGAKMWPLVVSCYQLEQDESRTGQMVLFLVNDSLRFVEPQIIQTDGSGILDGKWLNRGRRVLVCHVAIHRSSPNRRLFFSPSEAR